MVSARSIYYPLCFLLFALAIFLVLYLPAVKEDILDQVKAQLDHISKKEFDRTTTSELQDDKREINSGSKDVVTERTSGSEDTVSPLRSFEEYLATQQAVCRNMKRFGGVKPTLQRPDPDGAWWVCVDKEVGINRQNCIVYSIGIKQDWSFDEDMARYGCEVFSFDPSIGLEDHLHSPKVHFYNIGLSNINRAGNKEIQGRKSWNLKTLDTIINDLGHSENLIDVLKIDIESDEWKSIPQMLESRTLQKKVVQMTVEYHGANTLKLGIVKSLEMEGFLITHLHRNAMHAQCFEVSYINTNLVNLMINSFQKN